MKKKFFFHYLLNAKLTELEANDECKVVRRSNLEIRNMELCKSESNLVSKSITGGTTE